MASQKVIPIGHLQEHDAPRRKVRHNLSETFQGVRQIFERIREGHDVPLPLSKLNIAQPALEDCQPKRFAGEERDRATWLKAHHVVAALTRRR